MSDLPDYYTQTSIAEAEAASFKGGLDANKSATPVSRDIYLATDTLILYVCIVDGAWTGFDASIIVQGILTLYENMDANSKKITDLAAPTLANDAARKAYVDTLHALCLLLTGGAMTGDIAMGANRVTGLADPALAQDAATRAYVLARCGLYLPLTGGTLTGDLSIGAHLLKTTNLAIKQGVADWFYIRNAADNAYKNIALANLGFYGALSGNSMTVYLAPYGVNGSAIVFRGRDDGVGNAEVARIVGAAVAYWQMTRPFVMSPYTGALLAVEGAMGYDGDDDKVHYRDAGAERILAREDLFTTLVAFNDHSARHEDGGDDEISLAGLAGETVTAQPPKAHEGSHVQGGSDDIDSALAIAAMADLATGKIWQGNANRPTEVDIPVPKTIATGSYVGNASNNRQVTTGFKCSLVIIIAQAAGSLAAGHIWVLIPSISADADTSPATVIPAADAVLHGTDGFEVDEDHANETGATYYYWAISE